MNHSLVIQARTVGMREEVTNTYSDASSDADMQLMDRLAENDTAALETLIERFGDKLSLLIGRLTAWGPDRDDLLQDVFLTAWQKAGTFRGEGSLEGWLRQLAVNRCRKHHRTKQAFLRFFEKFSRQQPISTDDHYGTNSADPIEAEQSALANALTKLKPDERMLIVLFYLEELPGTEVSQLLKISNETLHVRLHRARKKLRDLIQKESHHE